MTRPVSCVTMLAALCSGVILSQAYRTVAAVMVGSLQQEFGASARNLGLFAAAFHLAFAVAQPAVGVAVDMFGARRTVGCAFVVAVAGVLISMLAPTMPVLIGGQLLIGLGCSPAFIATTVFVARHFPANRFAKLSGIVLGVSGLGLLLTGTPLAWVIDRLGWRVGFLVLGLVTVLAWLAIVRWVREDAPAVRPATLSQALRAMVPILTARHTPGILALAATTYAAYMTVRGLWSVPLLVERYDLTLLESGHVILAASAVALVGPPLFGALTLGAVTRRWTMALAALANALLITSMALVFSLPLAVLAIILLGLFMGAMVLQYADIRAAYGAESLGRAISVLNVATFSGIALMQALTGLVASVASEAGYDPQRAALLCCAGLLTAAAVAYLLLPWPAANAAGAARSESG